MIKASIFCQETNRTYYSNVTQTLSVLPQNSGAPIMKKPVDQVVAVGETANYTLPAASDPDFESVNIVVDMGKA